MNKDIKKTIEEKALQLFSKLSYSKTSVSDIASSANIGKGTIYLYFNTKEDILLSIMEKRLEKIIKVNFKYFNDKKIEPFDKLYKFLYLWIDEIIKLKDLLFGNFEEISIKMVKDIFLKFNPFKNISVKIIFEFFKKDLKTNISDDDFTKFLNEYIRIVSSRLILYFIETDWDKVNIEDLKKVIKYQTELLFNNFVK